MSQKYFALAPASAIANEISNKWSDHLRWLSDTGYGLLVQKMYDTFYSIKDGGFDISISADGSTAKISVNHFKSLLDRLHSITTQSKLQFVPRARNTDAQSQTQTDLARGLLDFYADDKGMDQITSQMVQTGLVCLDSYIYAPWDDHQGETIARGNGLQEIRNGDQAFHLLTRFDVAMHPTLQKSPWYIIRIPVSKYDLAALHPDKADQILSTSSKEVLVEGQYLRTPFNNQNVNTDDDIVYELHFLHDRTPALPKGRYTKIVGDIVLEDKVLPYKTLPVVPFQAGRMIQTSGGDSPGTSLVGIQTAIDTIYSSNLSNNLHYNKQSLWSPTDVDIKPLSEGFNLIISPQPPQALQLTQSSPESYKLLQGLEGVAQTLSGVNATARGNPEASLKSGTSLAMMLSISVMSADAIQKNYAKAVGDLGTIVIHNLQQFASEPRIAYIGGVSKKSFAKEFTNQDIISVDRITVDIGNPLLSNLGGRYEMVQQWMQFGVVKDPKKLIEFLRTGQVDSITEDDFKDTILVRAENEMLRKGQTPKAAIFDMHPEHINEHRRLANDPEIRNNPIIMKALLAHEMEHIQLMKSMDPDLAAVLGMVPLPSQQQPPAPPQGAGPMGDNPEQLPNVPNLPQNAPPIAQDAYQEVQQSIPPELQEGQ